jgi:hypothetical protein
VLSPYVPAWYLRKLRVGTVSFILRRSRPSRLCGVCASERRGHGVLAHASRAATGLRSPCGARVPTPDHMQHVPPLGGVPRRPLSLVWCCALTPHFPPSIQHSTGVPTSACRHGSRPCGHRRCSTCTQTLARRRPDKSKSRAASRMARRHRPSVDHTRGHRGSRCMSLRRQPAGVCYSAVPWHCTKHPSADAGRTRRR